MRMDDEVQKLRGKRIATASSTTYLSPHDARQVVMEQDNVDSADLPVLDLSIKKSTTTTTSKRKTPSVTKGRVAATLKKMRTVPATAMVSPSQNVAGQSSNESQPTHTLVDSDTE